MCALIYINQFKLVWERSRRNFNDLDKTALVSHRGARTEPKESQYNKFCVRERHAFFIERTRTYLEHNIHDDLCDKNTHKLEQIAIR